MESCHAGLTQGPQWTSSTITRQTGDTHKKGLEHMPPRSAPTQRQLRIGVEMRKMRMLAGMTPRDMADALDTDTTKISQIELGRFGVSPDRIRSWADAAKCTNGQLIDALVSMVQERRGRRWFDEYREQLPSGFIDIAELEYYADPRRGLTTWGTTYIPGLVQTSGYAGGVFARVRPALPRHDLEVRTAFRVMRQRLVLDGKPYTAYIHEAALRMQFGGPIVLREQLASLLDDSERPNVCIRAVPFDIATFPGAGENHTLAAGAIPELDTVQIDLTRGPQFIHHEPDLRAYRTMIAEIEESALSPERSRDFIHKLMKELKG
ncbi:Scr1 family TA system antitoxin-like transcriptional regulator [Kitasatospora sp. RB6PN24]|uniref:helix-turn-helix domain-containing protein n=1 Tax=Kitasatospora humi TaxID=2893891 RepID=UPI001E4E3180|nr:Scr1 family TA system antitoxin-like transcriptional regulator [Kitasatospora humi]MCC9310795.1 Scr1 family TA system antitoxin-like transcriptional regulator [Kitasatospora humi]